MKKTTNCIFCDMPSSLYHNCRVCDSCKVVMNFSLSTEELFTEINKCIGSIQHYIESISESLHDIEQRYINKEHLSSTEQETRDFCANFQSCKSELQYMISNHIDTRDKRFRMNIYTLLKLSVDFSNVFHCECHTLTIES